MLFAGSIFASPFSLNGCVSLLYLCPVHAGFIPLSDVLLCQLLPEKRGGTRMDLVRLAMSAVCCFCTSAICRSVCVLV
jgi:hypothetical protein